MSTCSNKKIVCKGFNHPFLIIAIYGHLHLHYCHNTDPCYLLLHIDNLNWVTTSKFKVNSQIISLSIVSIIKALKSAQILITVLKKKFVFLSMLTLFFYPYYIQILIFRSFKYTRRPYFGMLEIFHTTRGRSCDNMNFYFSDKDPHPFFL